MINTNTIDEKRALWINQLLQPNDQKKYSGKISCKQIEVQLSNLNQLTFEVTEACNLKCKYCGYGEFYSHYDKRANKELSLNRAICLLNYLSKYWLSNHNLSLDKSIYISFYGGEPLLNFSFIQGIVDYAERKKLANNKFVYSLTTNAILIDRYMDFLVEKDFHILISLDGNRQNQAYRVTRTGLNSFDRVYSNIELLRQKYPNFFDKNINFNAVLHNKNSVSDIYSFFKQHYNKIPRIAELNDSGLREDQIKYFARTYQNKIESLYQAKNYDEINTALFLESPNNKSLLTFLHQCSGNVFTDYTDLLAEKNPNQRLPTGTCFPFSKKIFVTVNGKILPCERINYKFFLGHVKEDDIELDFKEIAFKYNNWYERIRKQCQCCYNATCTQCIFYLDDLDGEPVCKAFMNKERFIQIYHAQMTYLENNPHLYKKIMEEVIIS